MAALDSGDTQRNLKKKGFVEFQGDHRRLEFYYNKKLILHTKISHGSKKDLDDYLIKQMSTQCQLDKKQFIDLAKCPLSKEGYLDILKEKKLI